MEQNGALSNPKAPRSGYDVESMVDEGGIQSNCTAAGSTFLQMVELAGLEPAAF
jgi:hypothetical protein